MKGKIFVVIYSQPKTKPKEQFHSSHIGEGPLGCFQRVLNEVVPGLRGINLGEPNGDGIGEGLRGGTGGGFWLALGPEMCWLGRSRRRSLIGELSGVSAGDDLLLSFYKKHPGDHD